MKYKAHVMGATVSACGIIYLSNHLGIRVNPLNLIGGAVFGGLLPDIDHPKSFLGNIIEPLSAIIMATCGHRTFTHSLLFLVILGSLTSIFNLSFGVGLSIGILSHIILDLLTPKTNGVAFLYPFYKKRIKV